MYRARRYLGFGVTHREAAETSTDREIRPLRNSTLSFRLNVSQSCFGWTLLHRSPGLTFGLFLHPEMIDCLRRSLETPGSPLREN